MRDKIIVALDVNDKEKLKALADNLDGHATTVKIGMELYMSLGPSVVTFLKKYGFKIFLDLKLHDIPNTVMRTTYSLAALGVSIVNVHAAGGAKMLKAAKKGLIDGAKDSNQKCPKLIAVTQLTSTDIDALNNEIGISGSIDDAVVAYAKLTKECGLDGVVASAKEVKLIKQACGDNFLTITPGIRPKGSSMDDQKRVVTPEDAFNIMGTDYIVVGRAITQAQNPADAFELILNKIQGK
jgi:orotidine-5'-phosphate decarboxylase